MGSFSDALIMDAKNEGRAEERITNIRQVMQFKFGGVTDEQLHTLLQHCGDDNLLTRILQADSLEGLLTALKEQS